jgi:hypothetical protein
MLVARSAAALGLLVVLCGGCDPTSYSCHGGCTIAAYATIELACPATVTGARLTGPCAPSGDASLFLVESSCTYRGGSGPPASAGFGFACAPITQTPFSECKEVYLAATAPGVCHVELTFATGFTYSTDVTFTSQTDPEPPGCAQCPPYIGPASQATFMVHNPSNTCVDDAGLNAGVDACMDARTEAAVDAGIDAGVE